MSNFSLNLNFSHSIEQLTELLSSSILAEQSAGSIFNSPQVLVPNANMQRYLQLSLAKINGVCAHVEFPFLETGLFHASNEVFNVTNTHFNGTQVAWSIWQILHDDDLLDTAVYQPIRRYLNTVDNPQLLATKRWQLSQRLAKLMIDYESQRPEMVYQWMQNNLVFQNSENDNLKLLEHMQQKLYQDLFISSDDEGCLTLLQATVQLTEVKPNQGTDYNLGDAQVDKLKSIHVFTPSRLSQLHRQLLIQLGRFMDVNIYALNVCSEYWEDLQTEAEVRWQTKLLNPYKNHPINTADSDGNDISVSADTMAESFAELSAFSDDNAILKAWGKPGRETLKLFSDIEEDALGLGIEYQDHWLIPEFSESNSLLGTVQQNILQRSNEHHQLGALEAISSVQFANAPSVNREVEAVYNSILWNLEQNPDLVLNEIAVLVSDMDKYRFVIEQVFESLNRQHGLYLSYAIVDSSAAKESRYAEAVMDLFALLEDDFIRASVFKWLDNPCVQTANHFDHSNWQDWLSVVDHLGIYAGFKQLYTAKEGHESFDDDKTPESELFTWKQGLSRLHLSLAASLSTSLHDESDNELDVSSIGAESIGQLSVLLERLHQFKIRVNQQQQQTAAQWEQQLNAMFEAVIAVPADNTSEQNIQLALQQSLLQLVAAQPDLLLNFHDIKQFISHEIKQIPASKGSYLSGGVVCAALQPMRPIPFKITYILGLDEKTFPGQIRQETLDLTQRSRRIGDINTVENNNYLLLETLMCTRKKLYMSYVGMDLLKDEVIEPSASLSTLKHYCESLIDYSLMPDELSLDGEKLPMVQLPLDATHTLSFDAAEYQTIDFGVNYSFTDYLLQVCQKSNQINTGSIQSNLNSNQLKHWQLIEANLQLNQPTNQQTNQQTSPENPPSLPPVNDENSKVIQVDASVLAEYLANPQAAVLQQLGLATKHPEDLSLVEHEPHQLSHLSKYRIFKGSVNQWLLNPQTADFKKLLQQQHQNQLAHSKAPMELFTDLSALSKVEKDLDTKLKVELTDKQIIHTLKLGDALVTATPEISVNAIQIKLDSGQLVQVNGVAEQLYAMDGMLTDQVIISSSAKNDLWNDKLLKPFVHWCLWQLTDEIQVAEDFKVHLVFPEKIQTVTLKPWYAESNSFATRSTIEDYLKLLLTGLLEKPATFLPSQLLNKFKIETKQDTQPSIPFLKKSSKAKTINAFAYELEALDEYDKQTLLKIYQNHLHWPNYEEILSLLEPQASEQPINDFSQNLLPLFAMLFGEFEDAETKAPQAGSRS